MLHKWKEMGPAVSTNAWKRGLLSERRSWAVRMDHIDTVTFYVEVNIPV